MNTPVNLRGNPMRRPQLRRDDAGAVPASILAGIAISAIIGLITLAVIINANSTTIKQIDRSDLWSDMQDASGGLLHDVLGGTQILVAEDHRFVVRKVIDGQCQTRDWQAVDGQVQVHTTFHDTATCPEPGTETDDGVREHVVVPAGVIDRSDHEAYEPTFRYYATGQEPMPTPINVLAADHETHREHAEALSRIKRVEWALLAQPSDEVRPLRLLSGAAYTGQGVKTGTGDEVYEPTRTVLTVETPVPGRDQPVLEWGNTSPDVTVGWNVFRNHWEEGRQESTATGWEQVDVLDASTLTWTDTGSGRLPAGHTAQYAVQPVLDPSLTGGQETGPTSNIVVTGMRPPAPTNFTVTGNPTSLTLQWARPVGATSFDIYKSNDSGTMVLHQADANTSGSNTRTWVDDLDYGHSHYYQVVAVNRWEKTATDAGADRRMTTRTGNYTAPAQPTLEVEEQGNWNNQLTWAPAGWTGTGPSTVGGVHRDRGWVAQKAGSTSASTGGGWSSIWGGDEVPRTTSTRAEVYNENQIAGQYRHYRVRTQNPSGNSPWTSYNQAHHRALQRPPTPTCTTSNGAVTSHQVQVNVTRPSMPSTYLTTRVTGGTAAPGHSVAGTGNGTATRVVSKLRHDTSHTFTAANRNDSRAGDGWSETTTCSRRTAELTIGFRGSPITDTRSITIGWTAGPEGTNPSVSLEGVGGAKTAQPAVFDPLTHNTAYRVIARNTDGYNTVQITRSNPVRTDELVVSQPATPTCVATRDSQYVPTTVRFSTNGQSITRSSLYVTSAGSYSATATNTNTNSDGHNTVSRSATRDCAVYVDNPPVPAMPFDALVSRTDVHANGSWMRVPYATHYEYQIEEYDPIYSLYRLKASGTVQEPDPNYPLPRVATPSVSVARSTPDTWQGDQPQVKVVARAVGPGGASAWVTGYSAW